MSTQVHPKQILSATNSFLDLYSEVIELSFNNIEGLIEVNIAYGYDEEGSINSETITDIEGTLLREIIYTFDSETGNIIKEIVKMNGKVKEKNYTYDTETGNIIGVQIREVK